MTTIPPCPVCGDIPAGHGAETCLELVTRQRDCAIRELALARWRLLFAESEVRRWRRVALYFRRKREEKKEGT